MSTNGATPPRRARTAAGAVPPQIARDVTRVVMCAEQVTHLLDHCPHTSVATVLDALLPALGRHLDKDLRWVVLTSATSHVTEHLERCLDHADGAADVAPRLGTMFDTTTSDLSLDDVISGYVSRGIDAERVTWDVISRESTRHEGLIHKECNRLARSLPDRTPDELKGYGWAGLRTALRNYDPALGFAFSTYACPKINGAIRDGVRAESPIPKRLTTFLRKISKAEEHLTHELSRTPTYDEIAEYVDSSANALRLLPRLAPTASIEELSMTSDGENWREPACLIDHADPQEQTLIALRDEALHNAVNDLPADEAEAVRILMLDEVPIGEAASRLGVEPRQLRQRKARGLTALQPVMQAWLDEHELTPAA